MDPDHISQTGRANNIRIDRNKPSGHLKPNTTEKYTKTQQYIPDQNPKTDQATHESSYSQCSSQNTDTEQKKVKDGNHSNSKPSINPINVNKKGIKRLNASNKMNSPTKSKHERKQTLNINKKSKGKIQNSSKVTQTPKMKNLPLQKSEQIVNEKWLNRAIKELKKNKASGPDSVYNEMITEAYEQLKSPMLELMKMSLKANYIPKCWNETGSVLCNHSKTWQR